MLRSVPVLPVKLRAPRCGSHGNLHRLFRLGETRRVQIGAFASSWTALTIKQYQIGIDCQYRNGIENGMSKKSSSPAAVYLQNRDNWIRLLVEDLDMPHTAVRVGLHVAMRINRPEDNAFPSTALIAKLTGVSVRSVISALQALEDAGYLLCARKRNVGNRYWLRFKWAE